jgi:thiamine-monophosphate kinase
LCQGKDAIIPNVKVSELGEFGLIDVLSGMVTSTRNSKAPSWQRLLVGIGDDTAAWRGDTSVQLATVDSMVQDIHFSLDFTPWEDLGWKALAVNLSDIAAMGGLPRYALVALSLPGHIEVDNIRTMYAGMLEAAGRFGVAIIGGNISTAPIITITITVLGYSKKGQHLLTRSSAKPGDKIAVTDYLGTSAGGLEMLAGSLEFGAEAHTYLAEAFLHPFPRIAEAQILVERGITTAIDISDGLISDLNHICQASDVNARIKLDRIPIDPVVSERFPSKALEMALSGGEDYELLFTGSAKTIKQIGKVAPCPITVIGEIIEPEFRAKKRISLVDSKGNTIKPDRLGWDHFPSR